jgi:hypothetical protein
MMSAMAVKQDCPTGLARCASGAVEVTEGHPSCSGCACAWKRLEVCERGCVLPDGVELVREPSVAGSLCRLGSPSSTLPPADAGGVACPNEGERFLCRKGTIYACPQANPGVPVAVCSFGCAQEDETLDNASVDIAVASNVMCKRSSASLMDQLVHDSGVVAP